MSDVIKLEINDIQLTTFTSTVFLGALLNDNLKFDIYRTEQCKKS